MDWIVAHQALILGVLFGVSEALALIPQLQSNSVFQLVVSILAKLAGKQVPKA